ncbi:MAG: hypothetical protein LIP16_13190 [Clostridium sp.]|nr:hypothetical protein [Clostridium sp.]
MKNYYREQLIGMLKKAAVGFVAGGIFGGFFMRELPLGSILTAILLFGYVGASIPQGYRLAGRIGNAISPAILVLPLIGWLILWVIKLAVIIYGGMAATPIMLIYNGVKMASSADAA